jgi:hypothetical protein
MDTADYLANGIVNFTVPMLKPLLLWKLKGETVKGNKNTQIQLWTELPEPEPAQGWTADNEAELVALKAKEITIKDTVLVEQRKRMATAVIPQIEHLSPGTCYKMEEQIRARFDCEAAAGAAEAARNPMEI